MPPAMDSKALSPPMKSASRVDTLIRSIFPVPTISKET